MRCLTKRGKVELRIAPGVIPKNGPAITVYFFAASVC